MHRMRRTLTILAALAVIGVGAVAVWNLSGTKIPWQSVEHDAARPMTLTVSYVGSSCQDGRSVRVEEDAQAVTITIVERTFHLSCDDVGVPRTASVSLDNELGRRAVLDGSCARPSHCERRVR